MTETENERDISTRHETMAQDKHATTESDTTESTPDIFRSPVTEAEQQQLLEEDETVTTDVVLDERIETSATSLTYKGKTCTDVMRVEETENQAKASDSEDDIPVATLLRQEKGIPLTLQQIQDCKEGPVEERAIGVTIAKIFDGVEYRGKIDSFRKARQRIYYHVTYSDGDEEELLRQRGGEPLKKQVPHNKGLTVLGDNDFAETVYTPRYFYITGRNENVDEK